MDDSIGFGVGLDNSSIERIGEVEPETVAETIKPIDSVAQSEMAAIIALLAAWHPILIPPNDTASHKKVVGLDVAASTLNIAKQENDVITSSWETYLTMLKQLDEQHKASRELHDKEDVTIKSDISGKLEAVVNGVKQWVVDPSQTIPVDGVSAGLSSAFLASLAASNVDIIAGSTAQAALQDLTSNNPILDNLTTPGTPSVNRDAIFAAEVVASLYYSTFIQQTTLQTVQQAAPVVKPGNDSQFAINFANNVLAISTLKVQGDDPADNKSDQDRNKLIRVQLYTMALNLIYRTQFDGMTGKELLGLIQSNNLQVPEGINPKSPEWIATLNLINALKTILPGVSPSVLQEMMDYVDEKHSAESMRESFHMLVDQLAAGPEVEAERKTLARG
jgi:hypothetical protein